MPEIKFTISSENLTKLQDAFASTYNYQTEVLGKPNPETKAQFTLRKIKEFISEVESSWRANKAAEDAKTTEIAKPSISIT